MNFKFKKNIDFYLNLPYRATYSVQLAANSAQVLEFINFLGDYKEEILEKIIDEDLENGYINLNFLKKLAKANDATVNLIMKNKLKENYDIILEYFIKNPENESKDFLIYLATNKKHDLLSNCIINKEGKIEYWEAVKIFMKNIVDANYATENDIEFYKKILKESTLLSNVLFEIIKDNENPNNTLKYLIELFITVDKSKKSLSHKQICNLTTLNNKTIDNYLKNTYGVLYESIKLAVEKSKKENIKPIEAIYELSKENEILYKYFISEIMYFASEQIEQRFPLEKYFYLSMGTTKNNINLTEEEKNFLYMFENSSYEKQEKYIDFIRHDSIEDLNRFKQIFPPEKYWNAVVDLNNEKLDHLQPMECYFVKFLKHAPKDFIAEYEKECLGRVLGLGRKKYESYIVNKPFEKRNETFITQHNTNLSEYYKKTTGLTRLPHKPGNKAGIWAAPKTENTKFISLWDEFLNFAHIHSNYKLVSTFKIKDNAKVLSIDNYTDLARLYFLYPDYTQSNIRKAVRLFNAAAGKHDIYSDDIAINWDKVFQDYDIFYFAHKRNLDKCLATFDAYNIEQILIRDPDLIEDLQTFEIEKYKELFCVEPAQEIIRKNSFFYYDEDFDDRYSPEKYVSTNEFEDTYEEDER